MITLTCISENSVKFGTHCWGEHGLSIFIELPDFSFFMDTGASAEVLRHNLSVIKPDLRNTKAIVLSHGHFDHTNGLEELIKMLPDLQVYAHPDIFSEHYAYSGEKYRYIGVQFERADVEKLCKLNLSTGAVEIAHGVYFSGEIPRHTKISSKFYLKTELGFVADGIVDDAAVYLKTDRGTVVIFGCGHAGVINTLKHARAVTGQKIRGVVGGTHLITASPQELDEVAGFLHAEDVEFLRLAHCTGKKATYRFNAEFGEKFDVMSAGDVFSI